MIAVNADEESCTAGESAVRRQWITTCEQGLNRHPADRRYQVESVRF